MTLATLPERRPAFVIAAIGALFAIAYALSLVLLPKPDGRILLGDALHHYVQLRSVVFDRDLQFRNEYVRMYGIVTPDAETDWIFTNLTPTGHVRNLMPVGPAILWAPAFLLASLGVWLANLAGAGYPLDGFGRIFQATAGLTGCIAAAAGVWLACRAASSLFGARAAIWASVTLWLGSSALYYSVISPTYSHAPSLLANSAFWYAFVRTRDDDGARRFAMLGALCGAAALMRWQDATLLLVVCLDLLWRLSRGVPLGRLVVHGLLALAAAAIVFTPQMVVWQALYGQPLAIPQGGGFMRWTGPALVDVLVSSRRGLLTWTPIVAVALAGFPALFKRERQTAAAMLLFFAVSWYVNAAVADWWAGEAFGARRFVSCFPIFVLALAALLDRWSPSLRTLWTASAIVVAHTFLLLVQYQAYLKGLKHVVPYPGDPYGLWLARFRAPYDLVMWWLHR